MLLRQMAVAFLFNEAGEMLFLQKMPDSRFLGGYLVPVGGHIEDGEFNDPKRACLREIEEETGLTEQAVHGLTLRYIVNRNKGDQEIRVQYVYMGSVPADSGLVESEEGELLWIDHNKLAGLEVTASTRAIMKHYLETGIHNKQIYTGTMYSLLGEPAVGWNVLEDWEGK
ncbi:nucleoside triphosphate pyrophosphohydrolase [compost metagenome]